jgi:hypothetical protein
MRYHGLQRLQIACRLAAFDVQARRDLAHLSQSHGFEHANVQPADVELVPAVRQPCG